MTPVSKGGAQLQASSATDLPYDPERMPQASHL